MLENTLEEKPWLLVSYAKALTRPLSIVGILFGLVVLVGYLGSIEALYRPIPNGPATNPLTAVCLILLGLALRLKQHKASPLWLQRSFVLLVIIITLLNFFDAITQSSISALITPFHSQVLSDLSLGKSNSMGINSAVMFFFTALSLMLYCFGKLSASQIFAFIAMAIPTISFTGYVYGIENFYGQMSILTASIGFTLSLAALLLTADTGGLKAILSPYIGGRVARLQTLAGYIIPTILGFLLIKSLSSNEVDLFGIFVVTICWFIILMVSMSAIFQENIDYERRNVERLLAKAAMHDQLTGLPNRRRFIEFGQAELNRIQRTKNQLWLLILDIDFFKKINDTAGHEMGDQVLIEISKTLKSSVRSIDLVSRLGGEEFAVILVDTTREGAERVAENIRLNVENTHIEGWTESYGPTTISIGCASSDEKHTLEETLIMADKALYKAKESGRNQVVLAD